MCYDYTSYVKTITNDPNKPILADIIAYGFSNRTEVYVIISVYCVPEAVRSVEQHQNYSLFYKGIEYTSVFPLKSFYPFHSVMKYVLPSMLPSFRHFDAQRCLSEIRFLRTYHRLPMFQNTLTDRSQMQICHLYIRARLILHSQS